MSSLSSTLAALFLVIFVTILCGKKNKKKKNKKTKVGLLKLGGLFANSPIWRCSWKEANGVSGM